MPDECRSCHEIVPCVKGLCPAYGEGGRVFMSEEILPRRFRELGA